VETDLREEFEDGDISAEELAALAVGLGPGCIAVSEIEPPSMFANMA
jgi:hypothetical protein